MSAPNVAGRQEETLEAQCNTATQRNAGGLFRRILRRWRTLQHLEDQTRRNAKKIATSLVWYTTFTSPDVPCWRPQCNTSSSLTCNEPKAFEFDGKSSFPACMEAFSEILEFGPTDCDRVQLCAIAAEPEKKILSGVFSTFQKICAAIRWGTETLNNAPRQSILVRLDRAWKLSKLVLDQLNSGRGQVRESFELNIPSSEAQSKKHSVLMEGAQLSFTWQMEAPKFKGDTNVYIWQSDQQSPTCQYADIFVLSNPTDQVQRLLISLKSTQMLERFSTLRLDETYLGYGVDSSHSWSPISELLLSITVVYKHMIEDTEGFIQESISRINAMKFSGRRNPSPSKYHYLVHLEDCRMAAFQSIVHGSSLIADILNSLGDLQNSQPLWQSGPSFVKRLQEIKEDLVYLEGKLVDTKMRIEQLQLMIQDYLKLRQDRRAYILTFVAALYIPLAFASGFLGMNIKISPPSDFSSLDDFSNSTLALLPPTTFNQTAALLTALNNSGGRTWEIKDYWIIAISLLCTIPLSILAGEVFRLSIRFAAQHVRRLTVILVGLLIIASLYVIAPLFGGFVGGIVCFVLHLCALGLYSMGKVFESYHIKQGRRVWTLFMFVVIGCVGGYFYLFFFFVNWNSMEDPGAMVLLPDLVLMIPWIYLLLRWAGPEIRGWLIDSVRKIQGV